MESFSKFASRFERNIGRNVQDRSSERMSGERTRTDSGYREPSERRRSAQGSLTIDQVKEAIFNSNESQLDYIQDRFDEAHDDRNASQSEIIRAIDLSSKAISENTRTLDEIQSELFKEEKIDFKALSEANKDEILKAVFSNAKLLELLKSELVDKKIEEIKEKEENLFDKELAEKMFADVEDHVHKENVKCYRNVQAALEEQETQSYSKIRSSFNTVKILNIISIVVGAVNLGFILAHLCNLI